MAGDWIPMRIDLREDPAVMRMAEALEVREEVIVGYCHAVWSWLSRQCHAGSVTGVTLKSLGRVTNLHGFPELMRDVGWLREFVDEDGAPVIAVPHWDRWLSKSAKQRHLASERQKKSRAGGDDSVTELSRSERDKSVTTEEKRIEEKSFSFSPPTPSPPDAPPGWKEKKEKKETAPPSAAASRDWNPEDTPGPLRCPEFDRWWQRWLGYVRERDGGRINLAACLTWLEGAVSIGLDGPAAAKRLEHSIRYQARSGPFWEDHPAASSSSHRQTVHGSTGPSAVASAGVADRRQPEYFTGSDGKQYRYLLNLDDDEKKDYRLQIEDEIWRRKFDEEKAREEEAERLVKEHGA